MHASNVTDGDGRKMESPQNLNRIGAVAKKRPVSVYYAMLFFVVFFWGVSSVCYSYIYKHYSASALGALMTFFSMLVFLALSLKKRVPFHRRYLKVALPICLLNAAACLLQRIGLQYTTPAKYAFLEHISCVIVPVMLFAFLRKKPTVLQGVAGVICLAGCFVLSGIDLGEGFSLSVGDAMCALAGILLGVVVAAIGAYTQDLDINVFMTMHTACYFLVSLGTMVSLHFITANGEPLERIVFSFDPIILIPVVLFGVVDIALCWMLKTEAIKFTNPTMVAIISPFSAVITGVLSVIVGIDGMSVNLALGGTLILVAVLLPELPLKRRSKTQETDRSDKTEKTQK